MFIALANKYLEENTNLQEAGVTAQQLVQAWLLYRATPPSQDKYGPNDMRDNAMALEFGSLFIIHQTTQRNIATWANVADSFDDRVFAAADQELKELG